MVYIMIKLIKRYYKPFRPYLFSIYSLIEFIVKYRKFKILRHVKPGFADHRQKISTTGEQYSTIFKRLADAFDQSKKNQKAVAKPYQISPLWQKILDERFEDLTTTIRNKDFSKLQTLLENFHREKFAIGSGGGADDYFSLKKISLYKYQFVNTWLKYYDIYKNLVGNSPELSYALWGNPVGLYHNNQVIPIEAIRFHYYATEILSLLQNVEHPVISEIGGGLGGQAFKLLSNSNKKMTYILFDIPEMLILASYFLMASFPEKKILLYEEDKLDSSSIEKYDIIIMPNFMLPYLDDKSVDLFFNANSFSEMVSTTVKEYLNQIERICKKYLMHINHDAKFKWSDEDGKEIGNMPGSQIIPDPEKFKRIYKHPRLFARVEDKVFYLSNRAGHFAYLYEKINQVF